MEFVAWKVYFSTAMNRNKREIGPRGLSRTEVTEKLQAARAEGKTPNLSGMRMWDDYSGLDFTSEIVSKAGPFTSEILRADFRNANLRGCNFNRSDLAGANLRGTDLSGANLSGALRGCQPP